jgi:transcriptional regulator with XRE-family HTH domain
MADRKEKARAELRRTQAEFERVQGQRVRVSAVRRKSFEQAQEAGLTVREIAEETGLAFSRVAEILRGE